MKICIYDIIEVLSYLSSHLYNYLMFPNTRHVRRLFRIHKKNKFSIFCNNGKVVKCRAKREQYVISDGCCKYNL